MNLTSQSRIAGVLFMILIPFLAIMCSSHEESDAIPPSSEDSLFSDPINNGKVDNDEIDEASGLAASRINHNMLWTHNDSGDKSRIFLISDKAQHIGEFYLKDAKLRDAEDIAVGPGPKVGESYIFLGDIGDNSASKDIKQIYVFPEPDIDGRQLPITDTIEGYDVIHFQYPDRNRDAETLMVDPLTRNIYIVSKREINVVMYRINYPYTLNDTITAEKIGVLPLSIITGGDISPEGNEVLLKSYNAVYYYKLIGDEKVESIISKQPTLLPYAAEPQGEAICWKVDGSGYYTLSEEVMSIQAVLYFYQRK